jgi:hypothetical protein
MYIHADRIHIAREIKKVSNIINRILNKFYNKIYLIYYYNFNEIETYNK